MTDIYVFGPRYDEAEWNAHSQKEKLVKALCERCGETIMLIAPAADLASNTHTICKDCAEKDIAPKKPVFMTYADYSEITRLLKVRKKAKLN